MDKVFPSPEEAVADIKDGAMIAIPGFFTCGVPRALLQAIIKKGVKDLSIHTELFADAMAKLVKKGIVTNRWKQHLNFSVAAILLSENQDGYDWLGYNSAVQSRPSNYTNSVFKIAEQPKMVSINSAIGVDLHGNVYCTGSGGIWVITPSGEPLGVIETPEVSSNVAWGDTDFKTLYITAQTSIYRIRTTTGPRQ